MGKRNHEGYIDLTPHEALKRVINVELSMDELEILLDAVYLRASEMVPDTTQTRRLHRKLYEIRKRARREQDK